MSQGGPSSLKKLFGKKINEETVEEEILSMVEEGHEQGIIEESEAEMIFKDRTFASCITLLPPALFQEAFLPRTQHGLS